jgi:sarcosine oxidase
LGTYSGDRLVISAGAYGPALLADLELPLTVERQVHFWFEVSAAELRYDTPAFPIHIHEARSPTPPTSRRLWRTGSG